MFIRSGYSAQTLSIRSATEHHHHAADVVGGGGNRPPPTGGEAAELRLGLERRRGQPVEPDQVVLLGPIAVGADRLAQALEHESVAVLTDRGRLARVDDSIELADVGNRNRKALPRVIELERVADRDRDQASGDEVAPGAAEKLDPSPLSAEQLDRLHRDDDQREALLELERASVSARGAHLESGPAAAKLRDQHRGPVER